MLTTEEIRDKLKPYNLAQVARQAGVNKHTLYRLMSESHAPTYDTVKKLSDWLTGEK